MHEIHLNHLFDEKENLDAQNVLSFHELNVDLSILHTVLYQ